MHGNMSCKIFPLFIFIITYHFSICISCFPFVHVTSSKDHNGLDALKKSIAEVVQDTDIANEYYVDGDFEKEMERVKTEFLKEMNSK